MSGPRLHPARSRWPFGWLGGLLLIGLTLLAVYAAAIVLSGPLLGAPDAAGKADVLVVLGGDGPARADQAAVLWRLGAAPLVLIAGHGDCGTIAGRMAAGGVRRSAIMLECFSANTWQNAAFSAPLLAGLGARKVLLVTNWFHARRALASFRAQCPDLDFSVDSVAAPSFAEIATGPYGPAVLQEYPKTAFYAVRLWLAGIGIGEARASDGGSRRWTQC
jgi:uncharacterized SAM-binding protein YcdF (DUF218 family)